MKAYQLVTRFILAGSCNSDGGFTEHAHYHLERGRGALKLGMKDEETTSSLSPLADLAHEHLDTDISPH